DLQPVIAGDGVRRNVLQVGELRIDGTTWRRRTGGTGCSRRRGKELSAIGKYLRDSDVQLGLPAEVISMRSDVPNADAECAGQLPLHFEVVLYDGRSLGIVLDSVVLLRCERKTGRQRVREHRVGHGS